MIKALYANPSACVVTGNIRSPPFEISRSSRQGDPISSMLFILSLEPLAQSIRLSPNITPINIKSTQHHISLFADDVLLFFSDIKHSLPNILDHLEQYSYVSSYKINWAKSSLLPLNSMSKDECADVNIPVVSHFKYLGINVFASLEKTISRNYNNTLNMIKHDLERWHKLPIFLAGRISIIKMNVLPRINFCSYMLPLAPPPRYWDKIHSIIIKFLWRGRRPKLKLANLQRKKEFGGISLPNFKLYFHAFTIRPLLNWFSENSSIPWLNIEKNLVAPVPLKGILFTSLSLSKCKLEYGSLIAHAIQNLRKVEKIYNWTSKWHANTPIFYNNLLKSGGKYFISSHWYNSGIHSLGDIMNEVGLRCFQDLKETYKLSANSFFLYLQLRSALRAAGILIDRQPMNHPMMEVFKKVSGLDKGHVSAIYNSLLEHIQNPLAITKVWNKDCPESSVDWTRVWRNVSYSSQNLNNKLTNLNFIYRTFLTPKRCFMMKLTTSPNCNLCDLNQMVTFLHIMLECPSVQIFWQQITKCLSETLGVEIECSPKCMLLNDDSQQNFSHMQRMLWLSSCIVAKKMLAVRWQPPNTLSVNQWTCSLIEVLSMELSVAKMNGAGQVVLKARKEALNLARTMM